MSALRVHERLDAHDLRIRALEQLSEAFKLQMTDVGNEVKANTRLTEEIHGKTDDMWELFSKAARGFAVLTSVGNGMWRVGRACVVAVAFLGRLAKPLFWLFAIVIAALGYYKTGSWHMPDWWGRFE